MKKPATRERFLKGEGGFTLPEMLVTIMIFTVVLIALLNIFDMSLKVFSFGNNKVEAVESTRAAMEKMEREIRQAYPFNGSPDTPLFDIWDQDHIRFGNNLDGTGGIACPNSTGVCEMIGYQLNGNTLERDNTTTGTNFQPVAENVQSLTFTYYDSGGNEVVPGVDDEASIDRVLVSMEISVDQGVGNAGTQRLTTVIDLRNRDCDNDPAVC